MRHNIAGYKLSRDTEHRRAMWRNMAVSLLTHGQITTTIPRAKSVQPLVERLITLGKRGTLHARRQVIRAIGNPILVDFDVKAIDPEDKPDYTINRYGELIRGPRVVKKLFDEIAPKYKDRQGGYTRIVRLARHRIGDGGQLCVIQLVGNEEGPQVSGQYSRRRNKANKRMEFAAKLRKAPGSAPAAESAAPVGA
ncbi:MAG: 50S ribosomal protein L17 [Phycisphaeraceae bacterium]|nr:50S ribosomal protein L17 [Phycisphaeraceae bacterium]